MKNMLSFLIRLRLSMQMAFHGVISNRLRSALTILGVAIGVAAVVSLMGIGEGATAAVVEQFESLGSNTLTIVSTDDSTDFDPDFAYDLMDRVETLTGMSPYYFTSASIVWRTYNVSVEIMGVNAYYTYIREHDMEDGVFFSELQVDDYARVCVIGYSLASELSSARSPVGETISIDGYEYTIIGVLAEKGEGQGDGVDDMILIPYTSAMRLDAATTVDTFIAKCESTDDVTLAIAQISKIFTNQNSISESSTDSVLSGATDTITVTNVDDMIEAANETNEIMTMLLGGIAAVSLLVGGLGIMNIMLVAVSERTGEIGVRRALGARQSDLIIQFLLESLYLSIAGAIVGVGLGLLAMMFFEAYGLATVVSATAIQVGVSVSIACGIIFGVYPSINASAVPPVEALRAD